VNLKLWQKNLFHPHVQVRNGRLVYGSQYFYIERTKTQTKQALNRTNAEMTKTQKREREINGSPAVTKTFNMNCGIIVKG